MPSSSSTAQSGGIPIHRLFIHEEGHRELTEGFGNEFTPEDFHEAIEDAEDVSIVHEVLGTAQRLCDTLQLSVCGLQSAKWRPEHARVPVRDGCTDASKLLSE